MLTVFSKRRDLRRKAGELYGAIVAAAREPYFYERAGVPDTPEGRYEMIVLLLGLVLGRLGTEGERGAALSQNLVETFISDMDDAMREMGVGDLSVGKRVKRATAGLYERAKSYLAVLEPGDYETSGHDRLDALLADHFVKAGTGKCPINTRMLGDYARGAKSVLAAQPASRILDGRIYFPRLED